MQELNPVYSHLRIHFTAGSDIFTIQLNGFAIDPSDKNTGPIYSQIHLQCGGIQKNLRCRLLAQFFRRIEGLSCSASSGKGIALCRIRSGRPFRTAGQLECRFRYGGIPGYVAHRFGCDRRTLPRNESQLLTKGLPGEIADRIQPETRSLRRATRSHQCYFEAYSSSAKQTGFGYRSPVALSRISG